jgi:hypothetical protein
MAEVIKFAPGMGEAGLSVMLAEIIKGNLQDKPKRQNDFTALNGNIYIHAHDASVEMTMAFEKGALTIHSGKVGIPKISIVTDSSTLLDLANISIVFGLPYYFDSIGLGILKKLLMGELKLQGLFTHPVMLTRFTKLMSVK